MTSQWAAHQLSTRTERTHASDGRQASFEGAPATVLVVVYDVWLRLQLTGALATAGYGVVQASNGASGLRLANRHSCDLILVAPRLPELSGALLLEAFREMPATRHIPIVLVERVEWSPLAEASRELSPKLADRLRLTPSSRPESQVVPSVDALLRGDRSACARRSRRTAYRAASSSDPTMNPEGFTPEEPAHVIQARRG